MVCKIQNRETRRKVVIIDKLRLDIRRDPVYNKVVIIDKFYKTEENMDNFYQKLGDVMRSHREHRGLKAKDVAISLGIDAGNLSKYESGSRPADAAFLFRWQKAIGMSVRSNPFERMMEVESGGRKKFRSSTAETIHNTCIDNTYLPDPGL